MILELNAAKKNLMNVKMREKLTSIVKWYRNLALHHCKIIMTIGHLEYKYQLNKQKIKFKGRKFI